MNAIPQELNPGPIWKIKYVPGMLFNTTIKIPFLISDLLVAFLLYKMVEELTQKGKLAETAAFLWFLNPYLIWISAGWGMFDTLPALFTVASLFLLYKKRVFSSALCLAFAVAYKLYPILFVVPVGIYLFKRYNAAERNRALTKFYFSFLIILALLSLPYIPELYGASHGLVTGSASRNLGLGLTYWSIALAIPINTEAAIVVSTGLLIAILLLVYWKTCKLPFKSPLFELAAAELSCILAIFLSYRIICEQFFVWALPFIAIACIEGRVEEILYRASSLIALIYGISHGVLVFFMLPLAPWIGETLVQILRMVRPYRIRPDLATVTFTPSISFGSVYLAILGSFFSILMAILLLETLFKPNQRFVKHFLPTRLDTVLRKLKIQSPS
jgi:uncharacterized membrane protein